MSGPPLSVCTGNVNACSRLGAHIWIAEGICQSTHRPLSVIRTLSRCWATARTGRRRRFKEPCAG